MDIAATFAEARPRLVARAVGRMPLGIRALRLSLDDASDALDATVPVGGDVLLGVVLDQAGSDVPVTATMLKQWGVTLDQAIAASFEVHGAENPRIERVDGATLVTDRSYAAFLLRTPSAATALAGGTPVAIAPTDQHLVVGVAENQASLAAVARLADSLVQDESRLVSASALLASDGAWQPVNLPAAAEPFASDLKRRFAALAYRMQRPLLQTFYDRTGQDCFVADAVLVRTPQGETRLVATITEGVATALPWVDDLSLVRQSAVGWVRMSQVAAVDGLLVPLPDLDPPRWYPTRFPDEFLPQQRYAG